MGLPPKLTLPERKPADIPRPRVSRVLAPLLERRLSLVLAPAGYGKTLAVEEVVSAARRPNVWIALDPTDDDLATLVSEIVTGLHVLAPEVGELARRLVASEGKGNVGERVGLLLASEIAAAFDDTVVLVLDDAHVLRSQAVWEAIAALVHHPSPLRLVLVSKDEPPIALERLRAAEDLFVVTREVFPFDTDELRRSAEARLGGVADEAFLEELAARTDGWPALVRIALASVGRTETARASRRTGEIATWELGRFLREEIHGRLSPLASRIFDEIAVLGEPRETILAGLHPGESLREATGELERVALIVRHGTGAGAVLRPSSVAASLSAERASAIDGQTIHGRAAAFAESLGDVDAAIRHHRASGDLERAAAVLLSEAPRRLDAGAADTVLRWTDRLPDSVLEVRPEIPYLRGEAFRRRGAHRAAAVELARAVRFARARDDRRVLARALAATCALHDEAGEFGPALELGREAVETAPPDDLATQALATYAVSRAEYHGGSAELGVELGERAFDLAVRAGEPALAVKIAVGMGVAVLRMRGWNAASALLDEAREIAEGAGFQFDLLAMDSPIEERLLLDAGDLEASLASARRRSALLERVGDPIGAALAELGAGLSLCMMDRGEEALDVARRCEGVLGEPSGGEPVVHELSWLRAEALAAAGRFEEAEAVVSDALGRSEAGGLRVARPFYLALRSSMALRRGATAEVARWLDEATPLFEGGGVRALGRTWLPLLRAELALARGDTDEAARHLDLALVESRRTGAMGVLFDGPRVAARLVAFAEKRGLHPDYVAEVKARLPAVDPGRERERVEAAESPPRFRCQLLGSMQLWRPGERAPARWRSLKGRDLLAYLLLARRKSFGRTELVDAIWPEVELERGRPLLRFHLFHLRRTLSDDPEEGKRLLWSAGDECGLADGRFATDVDEIEEALVEARATRGREALSALERAMSRYGGPLCQSVDYPWVIGPRERLRAEWRAALRRTAALQIELGSPLEAEATLRLALQEDRTDEDSARRLMELLLERQDRTGAFAVLRGLERALEEDLGIGPDDETRRVAKPLLGR